MSGITWALLRAVNPLLNQRIEWIWFIAAQVAFGVRRRVGGVPHRAYRHRATPPAGVAGRARGNRTLSRHAGWGHIADAVAC